MTTTLLDTTETQIDSIEPSIEESIESIRHFSAVLDDAWSCDGCAPEGTSLHQLDHLRRGQPIVSAAGYEIGLLDGVIVDGDLATHLVLQPGHRFGSRDLILPTPRVRFDAVPLRVVLSRAAIDDLPPASIERIAPPTLPMVNGDHEQRRRIIRLCTPAPHRRTSIPMCGRAGDHARPALVAV